MTHAHESPGENRQAEDLLLEHHRRLDDRLNHLMTRAEGGDPGQLDAAWTAFETELLRHMDLEEVELLPAFAEHDPDEARALLDEHAALRAAMNEIGMTLQLHCLRAEAVADLARRLKAHAAREDAALYTWARAHASTGTWETIKRGLRQVARLGTGIARVANSYL